MCLEGKRPPFKIKTKHYPLDLKEFVNFKVKKQSFTLILKLSNYHGVCRLIEECWDPQPVVRPTFYQVIVRLNKIVAHCSKQGWWKDTFKLPWYVSWTHYILTEF